MSRSSCACVLPMHGHAGMAMGYESIQNDRCGLLVYIEHIIRQQVPWADVVRCPKIAKANALTGEMTEELTHHVMWLLCATVGRGEAKRTVTVRLSA